MQPVITMINRGCNGEAFKYHWLRVKTIKEASRDFSWESTVFLPGIEPVPAF